MASTNVGELGHWLWRPVPRDGIVVSRVLIGVALGIAYARFLPLAAFAFGAHGPGASIYEYDPQPYVGSFVAGGPTPSYTLLPTSIALAVYVVVLLCAVLFAVGLVTRTSGVVLLVGHLLLHNQNLFAFWGWSFLVAPFLLYTILADPGRTGSLDATWLRRRHTASMRRRSVSAFPIRLMQVHVCCMYFVSGFTRLDQAGWQQGRMLFEALATFGRIPGLPLDAMKPLLAALTYVVFALEPLAPLLLWVRRIGPWWALALLLMHGSLLLLSGVGQWNLLMAAGLVHFLPLSWQQNMATPIQRLLSFRPAQP